MVTVEFATAVPVSVGVVELVMLSVEDTPVSDAAARSGNPGVAIAVGVMVTVFVADVPAFPATSTVVAEKVWTATASHDAGVKVQLPSASAVAEPMMVAPSLMATEASGSATPLKVGVVLPVELPAAGLVRVMVAVVSIVTASPGDAIETLPALSVAVEVMLWTPAERGDDVYVQAPEPSAVMVASSVVPS